MNNTHAPTLTMQELSNQDIEAVSGGIIPLVAFALGTIVGGALTAGGIWLWNQ